MARQLSLIILGLICAFSPNIPTVVGEVVVDNNAQSSPYFTDQSNGSVGEHLAKIEGKRVAIIGAGAAGASSAYFLRRFLSDSSTAYIPASITVFEKDRRVGGRATTANVYDDPIEPVEVGATVFTPDNEILVTAARDLNLKIEPWAELPEDDKSDILGIFNGSKMVFSLPQKCWRQFVKIIFRYCVWEPMRSRFLAQRTVTKFRSMYNNPIFPFKSLEQATIDAGLHSAVSVTARQFLTSNRVNGDGRYARELIQGTTRATYAQNLGKITGFQAMVSLSTGDAMAIKGGNWKLFQAMIDASHVDLRLNTSVTSISKLTTGEWTVRSKNRENETIEETYDSVILAGPLQYANLSIEPKLSNEPTAKDYAKVYVTLFTSQKKLDPKFFGLRKKKLVPSTILTTPNETGATDATFFGIHYITSFPEILRPCANGMRAEYLYKVFSAEPLADESIKAMIGALDKKTKTKKKQEKKHNKKDKKANKNKENVITWIYRQTFEGAYPQDGPTSVYDDIKLAEGLWYTAGIETFVSTLETSSLMGMNVAKLIVKEWNDAATRKMHSALKDNANDPVIEGVAEWEEIELKR
jgi:prenylcysteine oxidase/farnesylcysteine lyase